MKPTDNEKPVELFGEILDIVHNAVILVDPDGQIFFANSRTAEMFRTDREALNHIEFSELFMPEDRQIMLPNILLLTRRRQEFETEIMLHCLDGGSFLGILYCSVFRWENEECIAVTIHDSSRMKAIERTLKHTERVAFLGNMLDEISHQIRNPIQVIGGLARRMKGKVGINERYMETIIHESGRLEKLLDTMNSFIRMPRPKTGKVSVSDLVQFVRPRLIGIGEQYGVEIRFAHDESILSKVILADLYAITEAIEAVVVNACESYEHKKTNCREVEFVAFDSGRAEWPCAVRINDHGCGIKAENLPQVTTHFFTNKTGRIGMGLTFALRIVEEQDGLLEISSVETQGTTVTFLLRKERRRALRTERLQE
ncbi:MAG: hypothetical protein A2512_08810 [Deltaproteobacteria bacterium RIFOXYD12_FULL_56_24]|nr:MAG: hypothetical protein A2512_08810 [Deltaproteobacteria bacterium RIFOXYD12_FULL_56_24]